MSFRDQNYIIAGLLGAAVLVGASIFAADAGAAQGSQSMKIVAFGTSLTERANWPEKLAPALEACIGEAVEVEKVARSGETTRWGLTQVERVVSLKPDIILIELYANDAAVDRLIGVSESRANYAAILDRLHERLPAARIYSMSMNPFSGIKRAIRPSLPGYVAAHREETEARGLGYVDNLPEWEKLGGEELSRIIPDGSHPLADEAAKIVVPELVKALSKGRCPSN